MSLRNALNLVIEPLVETLRHLKQPPIADQTYDILHSAQDRGTMGARSEVRFHSFTQLGRDVRIDIVGDFSPDFNATNFKCTHRALF
jgi:hypothetical protein